MFWVWVVHCGTNWFHEIVNIPLYKNNGNFAQFTVITNLQIRNEFFSN